MQNTVPPKITFLSLLKHELLFLLSILTIVFFSLVSSNALLMLFTAFNHNCELCIFRRVSKSLLAALILSHAFSVEVFRLPNSPAFDSIIHNSLLESTAIISNPFFTFLSSKLKNGETILKSVNSLINTFSSNSPITPTFLFILLGIL